MCRNFPFTIFALTNKQMNHLDLDAEPYINDPWGVHTWKLVEKFFFFADVPLGPPYCPHEDKKQMFYLVLVLQTGSAAFTLQAEVVWIVTQISFWTLIFSVLIWVTFIRAPHILVHRPLLIRIRREGHMTNRGMRPGRCERSLPYTFYSMMWRQENTRRVSRLKKSWTDVASRCSVFSNKSLLSFFFLSFLFLSFFIAENSIFDKPVT